MHGNNEVIYLIYPLTFNYAAGSESDPYKGAYGNLKGITARVGYVASLGVDTVWITPFYPWGGRGFGYDITDYKAVDPMYGTLEDFRELCDVYHNAGIKVIIDMVFNHCSIKHKWFQDSRNRLNAYKDFFVWADAKGFDRDGKPIPPNNWKSIWDDSGDSVWTWDSKREQFYMHSFDSAMPNLNLNNSIVQKKILDIAKHWFDLGVDGFRLDAVTHYACDPELRDNPLTPDGRQIRLYDINSPNGAVFINRLKELANTYPVPKTLLAEYWYDTSEQGMKKACKIFAESKCDAFFTGALNSGLDSFHTAIKNDMFVSPRGEKLNWAISNHDLVRAPTRLWGEHYHLSRVKMLMSMLMTLPGSICLYQGDELGLPNPKSIEDCKNPACDPANIWTPYKNPWDAGRAGFAMSDAPDDVTRTMALHPDKKQYRLAVNHQSGPCSMLNYTRRLIAERKKSIFNEYGYIHFIEDGRDPNVFAYIRSNADKSKNILCIYNFSDHDVHIRYNGEVYHVRPVNMLHENL